MSINPIKDLQPEAVWKYFYEITQIPRCSKHEEEIIKYLKEFAENNNLPFETDKTGNICIKKKASSGYESKPKVVLQGHVDMVCEKNSDVSFDFFRDPVKLKKEGDWLTAEGTTLGADNGIAVAMALAVLSDKSLSHGPVEALFTVDEETGLTGAVNLDPSIVEGDILLNIDSEEEGIFYIGCAGGITTIGNIDVKSEVPPVDIVPVTFKISGLRGGHSGAEIHEGRGDSVVLGARILYDIASKADIRLYGLDGGDKHNAIPREFSASFIINRKDENKIRSIIGKYKEIFTSEYGDIEPGMKIDFSVTDNVPMRVLTMEDSKKIITTLFILPHGVIGMSRKLAGLVETSTNLAAVHLADDTVTILTSQRSSVMSAMDHIAGRVRAVLELAGAAISEEGKHPAWDPDPGSNILKVFKDVYKRTSSKEAEIKAIHAGLECGVLREKFTGMEMVSFGPDIMDVHTPDERLNIPSVERTWNFLLEVLKEV